MKKNYLLIALLSSFLALSQAGAPAAPYYDGFDWTQTGMTLKNSLANLLTTKHTHKISYADVWNACQATDLDPTDATNTQYEDNRNTYHGNTANTYAQGNRNPFIDNPYLATVIWGGPVAENRWSSTLSSSESFQLIADINIYPNPSNTKSINVETQNLLDKIELISINGQIIQEIKNPIKNQNRYSLENLPQGFYFLKLSSQEKSSTKKVIIN